MTLPEPGSASQELFRLEGRIAFVSGAAGHLGSAMAWALAGAGAHVILNGRDDIRLAAFEDELRAAKHSVERAAFDIGDAVAVREFLASKPRLDILVNNAVSMQVKPFAELEPEDFAVTYASAVTAAFEAARAALPALKQAVAATGDASIINIASMYGQVSPDARLYAEPGQQSPFHYGPAKAALLQLTRHLAGEFGAHGIRVNALVPGPFPAEIDSVLGNKLAARTMLGRLGKAGEIAGPLLFLAAPASSFITGSAVTVDGGWTAW